MRALDFQAWIFKHRASVVRIQCIAGMGEQDFDKLVTSLRDDAHVSHYDSHQAVPHRLAGRDCAVGDRKLSETRSCSGATFWEPILCRVPQF